jgi:moderate conductance mechanosensitive channel
VNTLFLFDPTSWAEWRSWLGEHGSRILVIVVLLLIVQYLFRRVIGRVFLTAIQRAARVRREDPRLALRRADTLSATLNWIFGIFLMFLGAGLLLSEVGLNVSALIAGVGVVGIALGLGAQTLVKDVINGMFILIEDQFAVGDIVTVAGATGQVIDINPRRTVIRDGEGNVHSIPNSAISVAVNKTASLNRLHITIDVPFRDSDRAVILANAVCHDVAKEMDSVVLAEPQVVEQSVVGEGEVRLQIVGDARAVDRWQVEAELRRRLKRRFDAEKLEMRFEDGAAKPA